MNRLITISDSWIGTPFKQGIGIKGFGTDCYHLISGIIQEYLNLPLRTDLPFNIYHGQQHTDPISECKKYYELQKLTEPKLGSVLFFGKSRIWFMGMYLSNDNFITVNAHLGVIYYRLENYKNKLVSIEYPVILKES